MSMWNEQDREESAMGSKPELIHFWGKEAISSPYKDPSQGFCHSQASEPGCHKCDITTMLHFPTLAYTSRGERTEERTHHEPLSVSFEYGAAQWLTESRFPEG